MMRFEPVTTGSCLFGRRLNGWQCALTLCEIAPQALYIEPSSRVSAFDEILSGLIQGSEGSAPNETG
jgi:hypothetical protein